MSTDGTARFAFIDGLRGLAALWVALCHFTLAYPAAPDAAHSYPTIRDGFEAVAWRGSLGVDIFFVISGFVIAWSLRDVAVTPRVVGNFVGRRSLRLDPPYLVALLLAVAAGFASRALLRDSNATVPASWTDLVAHACYLQEFLHVRPLLPVAWTLCQEVQFYLVFILVWGVARRLRRGGVAPLGVPGLIVAFAPLAVVSLLVRWRIVPLDWPALFVEQWFLFQLGVLVCWAVSGQVRAAWFVLYAAAVGGLLSWRWDDRAAMGLATAVVVFGVGKAGHLGDWLSWPVFQYLGRISYSLYLVHMIVGNRVMNGLWRASGGSPSFVVSLCFVAAALAASILAAHLLYRLVERPSVALARRWKLAPRPAEAEPPPLRAAA